MKKSEEKKIRERRMITVCVGDAYLTRNYYNRNRKMIDYRNKVTVGVDDGDLDVLIGRLNALKEKYGADYTDLRLVSENNAYDEYYSYVLYGRRLENDVEYNFRIENAMRDVADKEEKERKEYERLAKKFAKS